MSIWSRQRVSQSLPRPDPITKLFRAQQDERYDCDFPTNGEIDTEISRVLSEHCPIFHDVTFIRWTRVNFSLNVARSCWLERLRSLVRGGPGSPERSSRVRPSRHVCRPHNFLWRNGRKLVILLTPSPRFIDAGEHCVSNLKLAEKFLIRRKN